MSPSRNSATPAGRERGGILFKILKWITIVVILLVLYLLRAPILRNAGEFWVVEEPPEKADAIVLLGDDNYPANRAAHAAELYHAGWAPRIVASGRYLRPYASIAQLMQRDLAERGVPASAIIPLPSGAANTREEAVLVRRLADRQHWRRLLVVTSNYHTRRAGHIYTRVFRDSADVRMSAANDAGYDPANWWHSRTGIKIFFMELVGYPVAMWETRSTESAQRGLQGPGSIPEAQPLAPAISPPKPAPR